MSVLFFGLTQEVINFFFPIFSGDNQWNSIFSLNSQQILVNKVSNDRHCIILWRKVYDFLWKFRNFEQKRVLGLRFSEKHQSEANKFWRAAKQSSYFQILHAGLHAKSSFIIRFWFNLFFLNVFECWLRELKRNLKKRFFFFKILLGLIKISFLQKKGFFPPSLFPHASITTTGLFHIKDLPLLPFNSC